MRFLFTATSVSSAGSAAQVSTDSMSRVIAFTFRARVGNGAKMTIGNSSTVSSTTGFSVSSTGTFPPDGSMFTMPVEQGRIKGRPPSDFWVNSSTSTTDKIDGAFLVEP